MTRRAAVILALRQYPQGGEHRQSESGFAGLWRIYRIGMMLRIIVTLTFDSSPIKGEGIWSVVLACCRPGSTPPLWIADQVRNDVTMRCIAPVDSRLRGNDGKWLFCLSVSPSPHLWVADQVRYDGVSGFTWVFRDRMVI